MKVLLTLMAMLIFSSYAVAQDDPCADESGAGYGLCNAYCVAMNCDNPDFQEASAQACEKVAANYERITGNALSCAVCPCFTPETIDENQRVLGDINCADYTGAISNTFIVHDSESDFIASAHWVSQAQPICYFKDDDYGIDIEYRDLSEEEFEACRAIILNSAMWSLNCEEN